MRRMVLLAQNAAVDSQLVHYAARFARAARAEVVCLSLVTAYGSTAELIQAQEKATSDLLRTLRARQTTADWVRTLENLRAQQWQQAERQKDELRAHFSNLGIPFDCKVLTFDFRSLFSALEMLKPFDLLLASRLRFPRELAAQGLMTLGDLGARFSCPAIDIEIMQRFLQPAPRQLIFQLAAYGCGTLLAGWLLWSGIGELGSFLMSGGAPAALANMAAAALIAFGYGKTMHCLLRVAKLDIY